MNRAFLLAWVLLLSHSVSSNTLTLEEVLENTRKNLPYIIQSEIDHQLAIADYQAAKGGFDFSILSDAKNQSYGYYENFITDSRLEKRVPLANTTLRSGYRKSFGDIPVYDGDLQTQNHGEFYVGASVSLLENIFLDPSRLKLFTADQKTAIAGLKLQLQLLKSQEMASKSYWDWVATYLINQVHKEILSLAQDRTEGFEIRRQKGDIASIFLTENETYILQRKAEYTQSLQDHLNSAIALSFYYRDQKKSPITPEPLQVPKIFPTANRHVDLCDAKSALVTQRPEWKQFNLEQSIREKEVNFSRGKLLPKLDLKSEYSRNYGNDASTINAHELKAMIFFDMPLENNTARGEMKKARLENQRIDVQKQLLSNEYDIRIKQLCESLTTFAKVISQTEAEIKLNILLQEADTHRWKQGDGDYFLVNIREQTTQKSKLNLIKQQSNYQKLLAELHQLTMTYPIN